MSSSNHELNSSFPPPPHGAHTEHAVQLYTDDSFLVDVLSRFIGGALAAGNSAVLVATAYHRSELAKKLSAGGLDTEKALMQGRYVVLDASETLARFMVNGSIDESLLKSTIGAILTQVRPVNGDKYSRIAVFGEMVALLWALGKADEAFRLERLWNELAKVHFFSLLCAYPIMGFYNERQIEPFLRICGQHTRVLPSESYLGEESEEQRSRQVAEWQQKAQLLDRSLMDRESEVRFRLLVDAVQDYAIFMLDPKGKIKTWNLGAEAIYGYKTEEIIGRDFSCFYREEDVRDGKPQSDLNIAVSKGRFAEESHRFCKDGSKSWTSVVLTPVRDEAGVLIGFAQVTRAMRGKSRRAAN